MIGKIISGAVGSKLAKSTTGGVGGAGGAILGMGALAIARRLSLPVLLAVTAGGYFAKKHLDKKQTADTASKSPPKVKPTAM